MSGRDQQRRVKHRLAVLRHAEEISGNVAATCRYFGISRPTFYKWLHQYEEHGEEGLRDRSSRPRTCPHQTDAEIVSKIVYVLAKLPFDVETVQTDNGSEFQGAFHWIFLTAVSAIPTSSPEPLV